MSEGLAQSVQTRLVRHAKALGVDPNLILTRYATERLLYRLSRSRHVEHFVLKGALPADLASVIGAIAGFVGPVLVATGRNETFARSWPPGGPWQSNMVDLPA